MLLNDDSSFNFTLVQRRLLMSGFTAAKKTITQQWFTPDMDPRRFWLLSFHYIVCLERSTARINGARIQTVTYWSSIAQALKELFFDALSGVVICCRCLFVCSFSVTLKY